MEINQLTAQTVWQLSEEEAHVLTAKIMHDIDNRDERNALIKTISIAFDFRTVSKSQKSMMKSLATLGYQFFEDEGGKNIMHGLRKRPEPTA